MRKQTYCDWEKIPVTLSVHQVALLLDVTDETIRRWCRSGELHPRRIGRSYIFDRDYVRALVTGAGQ